MSNTVSREKVTGVKFFVGNVEGKDYDSGKIFVEEALDFTRKTAKGYATVEYALADSAAAKAIMHNEFPLVCDVEFMRVTNGDTSKNIVVSVKPIELGKKAA
jgi:hypothetical protein